jgi:hypothetical protein
MRRHPFDDRPSRDGGRTNKPFHLLTPMEYALFEAEIEQRPYTPLGAYFLYLKALKKEPKPCA